MFTFAKAQVASFVASLVDYMITILCVELFGFWYFFGTGIGTLSGGLVNFSVSRRWVFKSSEKEKNVQLMLYFVVWLGYLLLCTSGVFLLTHYAGLNYLVSKVFVTLVLAIGYNYPFQRKLIFR
jgi:putative flippase GtrA